MADREHVVVVRDPGAETIQESEIIPEMGPGTGEQSEDDVGSLSLQERHDDPPTRESCVSSMHERANHESTAPPASSIWDEEPVRLANHRLPLNSRRLPSKGTSSSSPLTNHWVR